METSVTPKQSAYLASLEKRVGPERYLEACQAVFGVAGLNGERYETSTVNRRSVSRLIDMLKGSTGTRPRARSYGRGGRTSTGAYVLPYRVNGHRCEDAPCCGCCS